MNYVFSKGLVKTDLKNEDITLTTSPQSVTKHKLDEG